MSPTGTILLVDDEEGVRVSLRRLLSAVGHTVLEASHGAEAIELVRIRRGDVDLVLADVVMPEMKGTELAAILDRKLPDLPIILMSAYAPPGTIRVGREGHTVPVLLKPCASGQLEVVVQLALMHRPPRERSGRRPAATV
jgi:CheY-like chemotaxis protein